jgi:fatty-acyl-CoA synthase
VGRNDVFEREESRRITTRCRASAAPATSPVSTNGARRPLEKRMATVGRVHPHLEVKIVDPGTGAIAPRVTSGEQCTPGYSVMLGYWDDEDATPPAGRTPVTWRSWTTTATSRSSAG